MSESTLIPTTFAAPTPRTSWGQIAVCGLIVGLALYFVVFAFLLADALFLERNLIIKPIENNCKPLMRFIATIYYPEIALLRMFRVIPG